MIKCNSCGRDCRIGTEQIGIDDRGIPVYHRFGYCDNCRLKYDLDAELEKYCPRCGNLMYSYQTQCPNCGFKLMSENGKPIINDSPFLSSKSKTVNIAAILSLIFGIIGLVTSCTNVGIAFCGLAILLGICVLGYKENNKGMAIAGLVLGLVGVAIGGSKEMLKQEHDDKSRYESSYNEQDQKDYTNKPNINENSEIETETEIQAEPVIEEQVIYEGNEVVIYVKGIRKSYGNYYVDIYIENNSGMNLGFNAHSYAVNGIMTRESIYAMDCDVAAGKKANTELYISREFLNDSEIKEIRNIDVLFWAYDNDAMFKEFDTGQIKISTSLDDGTYDIITGQNIYDDGKISVDYLYNEGNRYYYCLTNKAEWYLDFDVSNLSINDYTNSELDFDLYDEQLLKDCQIVFCVIIDNGFKTDNEIEDVEKIEFSFKIRPNGDYFSEYATGIMISEF
ncbi:MAG: hypothetical protein K2N01_12700 [Lachnospiraceae bacterium]|nr:hypothetical protein [Lachnospiraceae bacterium]